MTRSTSAPASLPEPVLLRLPPCVTIEAVIRIGAAGWAYKDWNGIVYPQPKPRGFDPLGYIAKYFNTVEINSSF